MTEKKNIPLYFRIGLFGILCLYEGCIFGAIPAEDRWLNTICMVSMWATISAVFWYFFKDVLKDGESVRK